MAYNPINLGPKTMAESQAVALPTDQVAIPIKIDQTTPGTTNKVDIGTNGTVVANAGTGTMNVSVQNASLAVTGTFFQATQPVSIASSVPVTGPLTDTQLRATPVPVSSSASLTGGVVAATSGRSEIKGANNPYTVVNRPTQVYGWYFYNPNTTVAYVHFFDSSNGAGIIVGDTAPYYVLPIPPVGGANTFGIGITHSAGVVIGITQGRSSTVPTTLGIDYNIFYK